MSAGASAEILIAASELDERLLARVAHCRATLVRTFDEAQRALREHWFGLVVIDLNFDDVRMFDLLEHVRSLAHFKGVPVLCVQLAEAGAGMGAALDRVVKRLGGNAFVDLRTSGTAPLQRAASQLCILIIDHDVDAAHRLGEMLEQDGHDVDFAYGRGAGLDAARRLRPDVIFLDAAMSQIASRLRREPDLAGGLIIGLATERCEAGLDYHIAKPPDRKAIRELLAELLPRPSRYMTAR